MADLIPPRRGEFFTPAGIPTPRFIQWIEALTNTSNINTDLLTALDIAEKYPWPQQNEEANSGSSLTGVQFPVQVQADSYRAVTVTTNYTALDFDYINAKRKATITLPKYPKSNSVVIVRNGDGSVIGLNGNGRLINGEKSGRIRRKGTALTLQYFIDDNEWFAR